MTPTRCIHDAAELFNRPPKDDVAAALSYGLLSSKKWMICHKCGATGYWGGYGLKRKIRWGYGGDFILDKAKSYNAWLAQRCSAIEGTAKP